MISEEQKRAIRALEDEDGRIDPNRVIEAAQEPTSPLHGQFPWDDKEAAHQHRLQIARRLIGSVRMTVTETSIPLDGIRYIKDHSTGGYININRVRDDTTKAREAMMFELNRARQAIKRARTVAGYFALTSRVDAIETAANEIIRMLEAPVVVEKEEA